MLILRLFALTVLILLFQPRTVQAQAITYAEPGSMTFVLLDTSSICTDCSVVQASGRFERQTIQAYNDLVWRHPFKQNIYFVFHSPGGNRKEAMQLGHILRNQNVHTIVGRAIVRSGKVEIEPGLCASACVFAFTGGAARSIPKASRLGVHSGAPAFLADRKDEEKYRYSKPLDLDDIADIHQSTAVYLQYLDTMGIDLRVAIPTLRTPLRDIIWVSPEQQKLWKLATVDLSPSTPSDPRSPALLLPPAPKNSPKEADGRQRNRERR
jgi:hypothetical protein